MAMSNRLVFCAAIAKKAAKTNHVVVVVSAPGGATDQLLNLIAAAKRHKPKSVSSLAGLTELEGATSGPFWPALSTPTYLRPFGTTVRHFLPQTAAILDRRSSSAT